MLEGAASDRRGVAGERAVATAPGEPYRDDRGAGSRRRRAQRDGTRVPSDRACR
jgi:hypothetical protein